MKLLLDQNISRKLVKELEDVFPGLNHVYLRTEILLLEASNDYWNNTVGILFHLEKTEPWVVYRSSKGYDPLCRNLLYILATVILVCGLVCSFRGGL